MVRSGRRRGGDVESSGDALFARSVDEHGLRGVARRTDSYGFVLLTLAVLIWVFVPLAASWSWARVVTLGTFYLAIVVSLHTSFVKRQTLVTVAIAGGALLAVSVVGVAIDASTPRAVGDLGFALVLAFAALVVLRRVLTHELVTSRTISGAVAVYLLLALAFASAASGLELIHAGSFTSSSGGPESYGTMQYFSLVTIATLGYGDVLPVSNAARSLATAEAVIGQIYLVTIVARLVGLFGREVVRPAAGRATDGSSGPEPPSAPERTTADP
jgi:hypothetical protein